MASTLPPLAQQAAQNAIAAASQDAIPSEGDEEQVLEVDSAPVVDTDRTVFEDPKSFNVKHPLYSSWTLWFDSPSTKSRNMGAPPTPSSAVPPTPSTAAAQGWMDDIKKVISLDSVEEFWGVYNNIVAPSSLGPKANYYLFKEGIIPAWEDAANKDGGKWSIQLPRDKNRSEIDKMWLNTMLAAIGETYDPALSQVGATAPDKADPPVAPRSVITGVIVSARPTFYRISIWTRLAAYESAVSDPPPTPSATAIEQGDALRERIRAIGKHFKVFVLGYPEDAKLAGPMATDVEFISHKDSERKPKSVKKWII